MKCHHTKAEGGFLNPKLWKDINSEELFAFLGLCIVSGILRTRKEPAVQLRKINAAYARLIFRATMARDQFFQILCVIRFDDKTDKLAPIRNVFESIISTLQMAYIPNEHITIDEQLVVFKGKCPFHVFIKSKPGKYGIKLWVAADAKNFYACDMQVYTGKSGGVREKKKGLQVLKDMVCHINGTGKGVTTDNIFTSCKLLTLLLSKNMTVVGTLKKNKSVIPALLLCGKQRDVPSSIFGFTNDLTLVSHVPGINKTAILLSSQHHDDTNMGEEKDHKPDIIMQYNATKSGDDVQDKLVREYTCTRSTRHWPLTLFLNLIGVACVNASVLWMLKYPTW